MYTDKNGLSASFRYFAKKSLKQVMRYKTSNTRTEKTYKSFFPQQNWMLNLFLTFSYILKSSLQWGLSEFDYPLEPKVIFDQLSLFGCWPRTAVGMPMIVEKVLVSGNGQHFVILALMNELSHFYATMDIWQFWHLTGAIINQLYRFSHYYFFWPFGLAVLLLLTVVSTEIRSTSM